MKPLALFLVGSMGSLVLLGAGCWQRLAPSSAERPRTSPPSIATNPARGYRDAQGNILLPSTTNTPSTTDSTLAPNIKPLEINPDGKGPTSTLRTP